MKRGLASTLFLLFLATACSQTSGHDPGAPDEKGGGPVGAASCVKMYSPETLKEQEFALDGTVKAITFPAKNQPEGDTEDFGSATFTVQTWFKGGPGPEATLKAGVPLGTVTSADFPELRKGNRYLVSGEQNFMHGCGFTRVHSETEAGIWKDAFAN